MTDKERIEKEAIEYVIRATGYQVLSEHDHWKEAYIAGATAERQKVWNEAIDECLIILSRQSGTDWVNRNFLKHELEALKHKQP